MGLSGNQQCRALPESEEATSGATEHRTEIYEFLFIARHKRPHNLGSWAQHVRVGGEGNSRDPYFWDPCVDAVFQARLVLFNMSARK